MIDFVPIATSAVAALVPLLAKATEKGVEKAGEQVSVTLFDALKKRLSPPSAKDALDDLAKTPADADVQATLRVQLRKAMETDPTLATALQDLLKDHSAPSSATTLAANVSGSGHSVNQIAGYNNTVGR